MASILVDSPQDSLVAEEWFIELTVVSEAHVSHYRSHLGVGCLVVFDPYLHSDRTGQRREQQMAKVAPRTGDTLGPFTESMFCELTRKNKMHCSLYLPGRDGRLLAVQGKF